MIYSERKDADKQNKLVHIQEPSLLRQRPGQAPFPRTLSLGKAVPGESV